MRGTRYYKIYRAPDGELVAGERPVFGGALPSMEGYEMDYQYGAYDNLGDEYEMGRASVPMRRAGGQRGLAAPRGRQSGMRPQPMQASSTSTQKWQKTAVTGQAITTAPAAFNIQIRVQFDFVAQDWTVNAVGATACVINSVIFGDYTVWNDATGVPDAAFAIGSFLRGVVKGAKIKGGLDIQVNGVAAGGDTYTVVFFGLKPQTTC